MSKILSRILRHKLDEILDELESAPCIQLNFEHLDVCHWALQNQPLMGASKPAEA